MISAVPEGAAFVATLRQHGVPISFADELPGGADTQGSCRVPVEVRGDGSFTAGTPELRLLRAASDAAAAGTLLHEGRHALQALADAYPSCRPLSKQDYVALVSIVEADAASFAMLMALKLYVATGNADLLVETVRTDADDIALDKLARAAAADPAVLDDPKSQRQLFEAWYDSKYLRDTYGDYAARVWESRRKQIEGSFGPQPAPPLTGAVIAQVGALSPQNYLDIPDFPAVTPGYRLAVNGAPRPAGPAP
jgi:hypothetical protein